MTTATPALTVHRIEVHPTALAGDPVGDRLVREAAALGVVASAARTAKVYLIQTEADVSELAKAHTRLLADPVTEEAYPGARPVTPGAAFVEVHPLPGVMDPAAATVRDALRDLFGIEAEVHTGRRYEIDGITPEEALTVAGRLLANPVVSAVHTEPFEPDELPSGHSYELKVTHVPIRELDDGALERLSREAHLFLDLAEMRAIRDEYRLLGREPSDIELETLAQTWSEHCVHKTLKSNIRYTTSVDPELDPIDWAGRPGHTVNGDGSVTIENLLKSTVAAATHELIAEGHADWCISVFEDNAGVIAFDDETAVCVKVETHNHPSALEPYGGAATGIGGCIRDIIGTGLAAKPIASTDVFCVGTPTIAEVPAGCLHPTRILSEVVAGVRDYGNRMGIPTVNGAVWFDDRYVGNPLVYCGCVGVMPRGEGDSMIFGSAKPGDRIIALGGRTGRDGIHGATFSSAELTDTHADEFSHAVQIGNAIEEKRVLDAILRARDYVAGEALGTGHQALGKRERRPLFNAITDCGAGGFSSAVGEMGEKVGAEVHLERAPLKYDGLSYTEIWISEAQERMVLAVPEENLAALKAICDEEHVELADLGHFGVTGADGEAELVLHYAGTEVGRLPMHFLHEGIPTPVREADWSPRPVAVSTPREQPSVKEALLTLLAHPNIASKHHIIRQYDHEVQGNTVIRPLGGPMQRGPMDAAVIEPVPGSGKGLAIACGLATHVGDPEAGGDPYLMALAAIDECVRNLVCVGADPERIAILDNFCWPSCKKPENLASLVRAAEGCYDGAKAYRTPFISGKDSLNNQFTTDGGKTIEIPPTLLISGVGIVEDVSKCVTMDAKRAGNKLVLLGPHDNGLGGSHYQRLYGTPDHPRCDAGYPEFNADDGRRFADAVARLVERGIAKSVHDVSDGGALVTIAEMLIAGSRPNAPIGFELESEEAADLWWGPAALFAEGPSSYIVEIEYDERKDDPFAEFHDACFGNTERPCGWSQLGLLNDSGQMTGFADGVPVSVEELAQAWLGTFER